MRAISRSKDRLRKKKSPTAALKLFRKAKRTKNGRVRSPVFLAIGGGGHVDALLEEMREVPC